MWHWTKKGDYPPLEIAQSGGCYSPLVIIAHSMGDQWAYFLDRWFPNSKKWEKFEGEVEAWHYLPADPVKEE